MRAKDALTAVHGARGPRDVVVTTMMPARDWMTLPPHPLDMVLVPSAMGHATSMGLGIAIAQPRRRVIVCNGDGSMLMNLGSLVSIVAARAKNLVVLVFNNGTYEVTGSQPVPGGTQVDYCAIARGAGFARVFEFSDIATWRAGVRDVLDGDGPTFVLLRVEPVFGETGPGGAPPRRGPGGRVAT
jgi:phosphonopyruvate decarboxylase